jgi:hypothetical protein
MLGGGCTTGELELRRAFAHEGPVGGFIMDKADAELRVGPVSDMGSLTWRLL